MMMKRMKKFQRVFFRDTGFITNTGVTKTIVVKKSMLL